MKNFIFAFIAVSLLIACNKGEESTTKPINPDEVVSLKVNQSAELTTEDWKITLLEITEDSRCPNTVDCIWAGNVVVEFRVEKGGESTIKSLTDNSQFEPNLSSEFEAFGHVVKLDEVLPYPETVAEIPQDDYEVKFTVD